MVGMKWNVSFTANLEVPSEQRRATRDLLLPLVAHVTRVLIIPPTQINKRISAAGEL
jgi:hypothetical protein